MNDTEEQSSLDGSDDLKAVGDFIKANPSAAIACLALIFSVLSSIQAVRSANSSARSAEHSALQLRLASRPSLYGHCTPTQNNNLKLSPVPNATWFAIRPDEALQMGGYSLPLPNVPNYEAEYPFMVARCSLTNVGKGIAANIQLEIQTLFIHNFKDTPVGIPQSVSIDFLAPGERYEILIANRTPVPALVFMPQVAAFDVGVTGEHVTDDPVLHGNFWTEVSVDNKARPQSLKPAP